MRLNPFRFKFLRSKLFIGLALDCLLSGGAFYLANLGLKAVSTNEYCDSCHVHPQATKTWKEGPHYKNESGVVVNCVDCHLPPEGFDHFYEKARAGIRDVYGFYFTDTSAIDWDEQSTLEAASLHTFEVSCIRCHQELFPINMSTKGVDAHLHYRKNRAELRCINCHLKTGHFHEGADVQVLPVAEAVLDQEPTSPLLSELAPGQFATYTEQIPSTPVKFEMIAVPGGTFMMGSPDSEWKHDPSEGPQRQVEVSPFWIGRLEVSWREFDVYYSQTATRGKNEKGLKSDAITGPTPPYGSPDQGWGKGFRPAITMSFYAAQKYCEWLSSVTGRKYRLPTEAEWEYAARAGTTGAYFFATDDGSSWFSRFMGRLFGGGAVDEQLLGEYAVYKANSKMRTYPGASKKPNPWGIHNMYGNVREFCSDFYDANILAAYPEGSVTKDPKGPAQGQEHVVRGGSFKSEAWVLRSAARDRTMNAAWLKTDPQTPKSVWWYSDCTDVGFRVVRELEPGEKSTPVGGVPAAGG